MGRLRGDYWDSHRARRAYRARRFAPRVYSFDREAIIQGERGRVCLETITTPPKDTPNASCRVLARWTGALPVGSVIIVEDRHMAVLRVRPSGGRLKVAHILCREADKA